MSRISRTELAASDAPSWVWDPETRAIVWMNAAADAWISTPRASANETVPSPDNSECRRVDTTLDDGRPGVAMILSVPNKAAHQLILDSGGRIIDADAAAAALWASAPTALRGARLSDLIGGVEARRLASYLRNGATNACGMFERGVDLRLLGRDGRERRARTRVSPHPESPKAWRVELRAHSETIEGRAKPTTSHRRRQEAARRRRRRSLQEIRTPLTTIGGFTEMIRADMAMSARRRHRDYLDAILKAVSDITARLDRLAGRAHYQPQKTANLSIVAQTAIRTAPMKAGIVFADDFANATVAFDPRQLGDALERLLQRVATARVGDFIELRLRRAAAGGAALDLAPVRLKTDAETRQALQDIDALLGPANLRVCEIAHKRSSAPGVTILFPRELLSDRVAPSAPGQP